MMTSFMPMSQKLVFHQSKCTCAIKRILSITAMYVSSSSFMYLGFPCYCDACLNSSALRVGLKTLLNTIQDAAIEASFMVSYKLAKRDKPFSDSEFIKECMSDVVGIMCPEQKTKMDSTALSRRSVDRCGDKISDDLMSQLKDTSKQFLWYSLALSDSTDIQDTAQLLVFIRGMDANFQLTEEILSVESLKNNW